MQRVVTIVDYGRSNLLSVQRALEYCGAQVQYAQTPAQLNGARILVLPGVGALADGAKALKRSGLDDAIVQLAAQGVPVLGICLGMQLLFCSSCEGGFCQGLGLLPGKVIPIPGKTTTGARLKVPHIGWEALHFPNQEHRGILKALPENSEAYFVHSYHAQCAFAEDVIADFEYGGHALCAAVWRKNLFGLQFHPEKSGPVGLTILKTFLDEASSG